MARRAEEISSIIQKEIESFGQPVRTVNVGTVVEVGDGIARIHGLSGVMSSELVELEYGGHSVFQDSAGAQFSPSAPLARGPRRTFLRVLLALARSLLYTTRPLGWSQAEGLLFFIRFFWRYSWRKVLW